MASTTETGHAKNIANLQTLIEFVIGYGTSYNPSNPNLQLPALTVLKESADFTLADVLSKNTVYNGKVSERQEAFSGIKTMTTRFINVIQASSASEGRSKNPQSKITRQKSIHSIDAHQSRRTRSIEIYY
ncbi:hypothetical protein [Chryseobacterium turcicum]|uniref:Uncharacterized protein n=1 Tax=Chryseobacterium turcicum TaxID=2898076 RepID=A0A9Q3V3V8_9FLAO|nr:hypothetical protein [Chryseobacterium turcicum]MCD1116825.1 hypothetical protein [Chryseobacterium turcicum]